MLITSAALKARLKIVTSSMRPSKTYPGPSPLPRRTGRAVITAGGPANLAVWLWATPSTSASKGELVGAAGIRIPPAGVANTVANWKPGDALIRTGPTPVLRSLGGMLSTSLGGMDVDSGVSSASHTRPRRCLMQEVKVAVWAMLLLIPACANGLADNSSTSDSSSSGAGGASGGPTTGGDQGGNTSGSVSAGGAGSGGSVGAAGALAGSTGTNVSSGGSAAAFASKKTAATPRLPTTAAA